MIRVYAWPPVGITASEWTVIDPVNRSRSLLTRRTYESVAARRRRAARLDVSALAAGRSGAGYMEVLKRLLEGGVHKVRLASPPINWFADAAREAAGRRASVVTWQQAGSTVEWTKNSARVDWMKGTVLNGVRTSDGGMPAVRVSGLAPGRLATRAGEFVRVFGPLEASAAAMAVRDTMADSEGVAVIRLIEALPFDGRVNLGAAETGIFAVEGLPRAVQPLSGDWTYSWDFLEVFADEVGPYEEVNPW